MRYRNFSGWYSPICLFLHFMHVILVTHIRKYISVTKHLVVSEVFLQRCLFSSLQRWAEIQVTKNTCSSCVLKTFCGLWSFGLQFGGGGFVFHRSCKIRVLFLASASGYHFSQMYSLSRLCLPHCGVLYESQLTMSIFVLIMFLLSLFFSTVLGIFIYASTIFLPHDYNLAV